MKTPKPPITKPEKWEIEFDEWWNNHDDFMGGLSSNLVPDLKSFISDLLKQQKQELVGKQKKKR